MNRAFQFRRRLGGTGAAVLVILFPAFFLAFRYRTQTVEMSARVAHTQNVLSVIARAPGGCDVGLSLDARFPMKFQEVARQFGKYWLMVNHVPPSTAFTFGKPKGSP